MSILISLFISIVWASSFQLEGVAKSSSGEFLYRELHRVDLNSENKVKKIQATYFNSEGEIFAQLESRFDQHPTIPTSTFIDHRFDLKEKVVWSDDKQKFELTHIEDGKKNTREFRPKDEMIVGQGFDNFIRINFEKLQQQSIPLSIGVISQQRFHNFSGELKEKNETTISFRLRINNIFARLFVDQIIVEYDLETQDLLSYRGLSNLNDNNGQSQNVFIQYQVKRDE